MNKLISYVIILLITFIGLTCLALLEIKDEDMLICQKTHSYSVCIHTMYGS